MQSGMQFSEKFSDFSSCSHPHLAGHVRQLRPGAAAEQRRAEADVNVVRPDLRHRVTASRA